MRLRILRSTIANGAAVCAGEVYDLPDADGAMLLRLGKAMLEPEAVPVVDGRKAEKRTR